MDPQPCVPRVGGKVTRIVNQLRCTFGARVFSVNGNTVVFFKRGNGEEQCHIEAANKAYHLIAKHALMYTWGEEAYRYLAGVLFYLKDVLTANKDECHIGVLVATHEVGVAFAFLKYKVSQQFPLTGVNVADFPGNFAEMSHMFVSIPRRGHGSLLLGLALRDMRTGSSIDHLFVEYAVKHARGFYLKMLAHLLDNDNKDPDHDQLVLPTPSVIDEPDALPTPSVIDEPDEESDEESDEGSEHDEKRQKTCGH